MPSSSDVAPSHQQCDPLSSQSEGTVYLEGHVIPAHATPVFRQELPESFHERELFPFLSSTPESSLPHSPRTFQPSPILLASSFCLSLGSLPLREEQQIVSFGVH